MFSLACKIALAIFDDLTTHAVQIIWRAAFLTVVTSPVWWWFV